MLLIIVFHCPEVFIPHMAADFGRYPHAQSQQPCDLFSLCCSDGQDTDTKARKQLSDWEYTSVPPSLLSPITHTLTACKLQSVFYQHNVARKPGCD